MAEVVRRLRVRAERALADALYREMKRVANEAANEWDERAAMAQVAKRHAAAIQAIVQSDIATIYAATAGRVHDAARIAFGNAVKPATSTEFAAQAAKWAKANAAQKAKEISATTMKRIASAVARGAERGDSVADIARAIRQVGIGSQARAETIARTEVGATMGVAEQRQVEAIADELELEMFKVWNANKDDRTRDTHKAADGQKVKLDGSFTVGGAALRFPSDPDGPPGEVINCRCNCTYQTTNKGARKPTRKP